MTDIPFRQVIEPATVRVRKNLKTGAISNQSLPSTPIIETKRWNTANSPEKNGYRKPTPLNAFEFRAILHPQDFIAKSKIGTTRYHYTCGRSPNPVPFFRWGTYGSVGFSRPLVNAGTAARSLTQAKAKANRQDVNLTLALVEQQKTVQGLIDIAVKLGRAIKFFKRRWRLNSGSLDNPIGKSMGELGDAWLAFQYGIMPLIQDVYGTAELVEKGFDLKPWIHVTSKVTEPYGIPRRAGYDDIYPALDDGQEAAWWCGAFTRLDYRISDPTLYAMGQVGLTDPLSILWELVPFSFVIDWFLPIGTWLQSLSSSIGLQFLGGSTTIRNWGSITCEFELSSADGVYESGNRPSLTYTGSCVERTIWGLDPIGLLYFKNPFSHLPRIATLAALIQQLRK